MERAISDHILCFLGNVITGLFFWLLKFKVSFKTVLRAERTKKCHCGLKNKLQYSESSDKTTLQKPLYEFQRYYGKSIPTWKYILLYFLCL